MLDSPIYQFGHSLVERITPLIAPYQEKVQQLLNDYKVPERAAEMQQQATDLYKKYNLEKVAPEFVNNMIVGDKEAKEPAAAAPVADAQ